MRDFVRYQSVQSYSIIHLLPLCEGNMTVCSPEAGNITCRG